MNRFQYLQLFNFENKAASEGAENRAPAVRDVEVVVFHSGSLLSQAAASRNVLFSCISLIIVIYPLCRPCYTKHVLLSGDVGIARFSKSEVLKALFPSNITGVVLPWGGSVPDGNGGGFAQVGRDLRHIAQEFAAGDSWQAFRYSVAFGR